MNKNIKISAIAALAASAFLAGCASSDGMNVEPVKPTQTYVEEPISANNTETHFRAVGYGKSPNRNTARSIAFNAARANLATKIRNVIAVEETSTTTRTTAVAREDGDVLQTAEDAEFFKQTVTSKVNELIKNMNEYGKPVWTDAGNGEIEYTIGVEMAKADVAEEMMKAIDSKAPATMSAEKRAAMKARIQQAVADAK